jgi:hypothetical protein
MELKESIDEIFDQLCAVLLKLTNEQYSLQNKVILNATIGQHVRHIIELFQCLDKGYKTGIVNYEKRERNIALESDRILAVEKLSFISNSIVRSDKVLLLEANYSEHTENTSFVPTNYWREIIYNLEHTVHHMALIRVALNQFVDLAVPQEFGVAASTIKHQRKCAQ